MMGKMEHHTIESPEIIVGATDRRGLQDDLARMVREGTIKEFKYLGEDGSGIHRVQITMIEPVQYVSFSGTLIK